MTESPGPRKNDDQNIDDDGSQITTIRLPQHAPAADPNRSSPVAQRIVRADGGNIIAFTFAAGQSMPEHQAAHPIIVQCLSGYLDFTVEGQTVPMEPGVVLHLTARVPHDVVCPVNVTEDSVLMLTMLTGETVGEER